MSTCQAQGGNLLSITSLAEHRYIRGRHLVENTKRDHQAAEWNIHHVLYPDYILHLIFFFLWSGFGFVLPPFQLFLITLYLFLTICCPVLYVVADRLASVGAMVWIGLNHLKDGRGWQWSDGAPLALVNFTTGTDYLFTPGPSEQAMFVSWDFNMNIFSV